MGLNDMMEFDHPVRVHRDGTVTDAGPGIHAPESVIETDSDGQVLREHETAWEGSITWQGWSLYTHGYSAAHQQHRSAIMHASEYIGGRLENDILTEPGVYAAVSVETVPVEEDGESEAAGWAVVKLKGCTNVSNMADRWWGNIECDGYALIIDTAVHGGWDVDLDDLVKHVTVDCPECRESGGMVTTDACGRLTEH